jgi:hypothetical protein
MHHLIESTGLYMALKVYVRAVGHRVDAHAWLNKVHPQGNLQATSITHAANMRSYPISRSEM